MREEVTLRQKLGPRGRGTETDHLSPMLFYVLISFICFLKWVKASGVQSSQGQRAAGVLPLCPSRYSPSAYVSLRCLCAFGQNWVFPFSSFLTQMAAGRCPVASFTSCPPGAGTPPAQWPGVPGSPGVEALDRPCWGFWPGPVSTWDRQCGQLASVTGHSVDGL